MAVRVNADADWISRVSNIGTVGHANLAVGGWFFLEEYNDSAGLLAVGHSSNGRTLGFLCNNGMPPLVSIGDSQTGQTAFASQPPLNTWVYMEFSSPAAGGTVTARWSALDSPVVNTQTRTNGVEGSVQAEVINVNRFTVGTANGFTGGLRAAFVRGYNRQTADEAEFVRHKHDLVGDGALFFWPLASSADLSDLKSVRPPTFNGTLTDEASPSPGLPNRVLVAPLRPRAFAPGLAR